MHPTNDLAPAYILSCMLAVVLVRNLKIDASIRPSSALTLKKTLKKLKGIFQNQFHDNALQPSSDLAPAHTLLPSC